MNKTVITITALVATALGAGAAETSDTFLPLVHADRTLFFDTSAEGDYLPIIWGLDTAWDSEENIIRGVRYMGADNIQVARVSFQPIDVVGDSYTLSSRQTTNLASRLNHIAMINGVGGVQIVLNNDTPDGLYNELFADSANDPEAAKRYADMIYATTLACQQQGWTVITASPLNEPDYEWNLQGSEDDFLAIAKKLKTYPGYNDGSIRISGGNTLNCDCALPWYTYLYDYIDEGCTHQLAGEFDSYADFFSQVAADGKHPTADELHNVMECIVGVEYGMKTGIWWGTAERARGEFCKASFGRRLAYSEYRDAWTAASVYRAPDGRVQAFAGVSERQNQPSTYKYVSRDRDVFFNGQGPRREYTVSLPGGDGYQVEGQTSAECVIDITWGEDVAPYIDGTYKVVSKRDKRLLSYDGSMANLSPIAAVADASSTWTVNPVDITVGGDFSYHMFSLGESPNFAIDILNWSLSEGGSLILYDGGRGNNEQWYLKYAGDGYFRIFSRHSNLCLTIGDSGIVSQQSADDANDGQLWRFLPVDAVVEYDAPDAPALLTATSNTASVYLEWTAVADADSYVVLRSLAGADDYTVVGRGITETSFTDNTPEQGYTYDYCVKSVDRAVNTSARSAVATATVDSPKSLVANWQFYNTTEDSTPNHFNCSTAQSPRVYYSSGPRDDTRALQLASTRWLQLPYRAFDLEAATIGFWINRTATGDHVVFDLRGSDNDYMLLNINSSGALTLTMSKDGYEATLTTDNLLAKDTWQHVALVIADSEASIYVDGALAAQGNVPATLKDIRPVTNYLGRSHTSTSAFLAALIHDLRVYNHATTDIASIMDPDNAGIQTISAASAGGANEWFDLMGRPVANPANGIYMRRTSAGVEKVLVK